LYVAFVDVLGFASAVSALSADDEAALMDVLARGQDGSDDREILPGRASAANLYYNYSAFQHLVREQIHWLTTSMPNKRVTPSNLRTALFSDSVYLASDDVIVLAAVIRIMIGAICWNIPIRSGIAKGNFIAFEWSTRVARLTDVHFGAPFLGSGVVRAYFAESKGAHGLRAIVHPSAAADLAAQHPDTLIPLLDSEMNEFGTHELVFDSSLWWPDVAVSYVSGFPLRESLPGRLEWLKGYAPPHTWPAYEATIRAVERMRDARRRKQK